MPTQTPSAPGGSEPKLQQIRQQHEAKLKQAVPQLFDEYMKIVVAGMKILYSPETHELALQGLQKITSPESVVPLVVDGISSIILLIYKESQGKMSIPMSIPAAVTLASYALGDIEKAKGFPMTDELIGKTIHALTQKMFALYKLSPEKVQGVVRQGAQSQPKGALNQSPQPSQPAAPGGM